MFNNIKNQTKMQFFFTFLFCTILIGQSNAFGEGYKIRVKLKNYENDTLILGYRLGKKTYVKDTLTSKNTKGEFEFIGEETLQGGIYLLLTKPTNRFVEFLISNADDQKDMFIEATVDPNGNFQPGMIIKGSEDNQVFLDYIKFLGDKKKEDADLAKKTEKETNEQKKAELSSKRSKIGEAIKAYQDNLSNKYPDFLSVRLMMASRQPEVPKGLSKEESYYYFRAHYWDNFNWGDSRLIRTPILSEKIEFWTEKLTLQIPDSVVKAVDFMMNNIIKAGDEDMYQYVAAEMLNKYAKTKVICMDAVYVSVGEKYYCNGKADWVDSAQLEKICDNVRALKPLQCGLYAPNIRLRKMDGNPINLYDVKKKFVALYFWDPDCGNCSKTTTKLVPVYNKYKDKGFEVYGVCSKTWKELDKCKKKVEEKEMDFINTSDDAYPLAVAKKLYDVKVNPYIILLDEDKKILWKRIDPTQLDEILKREFESQENGSEQK